MSPTTFQNKANALFQSMLPNKKDRPLARSPGCPPSRRGAILLESLDIWGRGVRIKAARVWTYTERVRGGQAVGLSGSLPECICLEVTADGRMVRAGSARAWLGDEWDTVSLSEPIDLGRRDQAQASNFETNFLRAASARHHSTLSATRMYSFPCRLDIDAGHDAHREARLGTSDSSQRASGILGSRGGGERTMGEVKGKADKGHGVPRANTNAAYPMVRNGGFLPMFFNSATLARLHLSRADHLRYERETMRSRMQTPSVERVSAQKLAKLENQFDVPHFGEKAVLCCLSHHSGQTIVTEMWKEGSKVMFQSKLKELGSAALSNAACTFSS
ncbi:hypothetical protein K437DRAFT_265465 [Tilletiaria anomala UBC 951]|uniref:Uncharacterized protein n=1 Tax=Tilletiaria anomala (strain ATCC 24038 / CBS 436.72 / UBC 951) TaxID=1037660 RepID=A0A066VAD0_TILAU|nr:uncharacterized protein K437DRAFT_265465 [Tilletiaria anomala UBC 951]KDN35550.1 hypothetical protein K437DRAFT_265465 [Tilletiaria anomala UBC 951]